jgi:hypothetical protein
MLERIVLLARCSRVAHPNRVPEVRSPREVAPVSAIRRARYPARLLRVESRSYSSVTN